MKSSLQPAWFSSKELEEVESLVSGQTGSYRNLAPEALYTSIEDFDAIFSDRLVTGTFVDLGCGIGTGCIRYGESFPERHAIGVDFESSRINHANKLKKNCGISNVDFFSNDLLHSDIPGGDTYFLYFPTGPVLDRVLTMLYEKKKVFTLVAIESHGDLFSRLALENWLSLKSEIPLKSSRLSPYARVFTSTTAERVIHPAYQVSYQNLALFIEDMAGIWVGDSFGLQWEHDHFFTLLNPPRTIAWESVKTLKAFTELEDTLKFLIDLRRSGPVLIETEKETVIGHIRKIYLSPVFRVELSSGEQVEWSHIKLIKNGTSK